MSLGHFLMAFEGTFLFALMTLIVGVGLFKGNIASQVGELYKEGDLRGDGVQIFYLAIKFGSSRRDLGHARARGRWHGGFGAGVALAPARCSAQGRIGGLRC